MGAENFKFEPKFPHPNGDFYLAPHFVLLEENFPTSSNLGGIALMSPFHDATA